MDGNYTEHILSNKCYKCNEEITFLDGTRIYTEKSKNGVLYRYIEYPLETKKLGDKIFKINEFSRKIIGEKYFYLKLIENLKCNLNVSEIQQFYNELVDICNKTTSHYDASIVSSFPNRFANIIRFFDLKEYVLIYLAMVDSELYKVDHPSSLGKQMILKSCEAILFKGYNSKEAATMFQRNQNVSYDEDYYDEIIEENDRYAIYGGYNGYDDDTIDYGFDGKPEATWNVD